MSLPVYFNAQISAIVDSLAKTAIAEITKLVEEGTVVLRLEMRRRDSEIEDLKRSLIMERELRKGQEAAARMTSDRLHAVGIQVGSPVKDIQEEQTTQYSHSDSDQPLVEHCGLGPLVKSEPVEEHAPPADTGHDTRELSSNFVIQGRDDQLWHPEAHAVCGTDLVDPEISSTIEKCLQMFSQTDQYPTQSDNTEMACSFSSAAGKTLDETFSPVAIKVEPDSQPSACMGDVMLVPIQPGQGQCGNVARTVASENLTLPALLQQSGLPQAERMTEGIPGPNTAYNPEHYVNRNRFRAKRMVNVWKNGLAPKMFICSICGKGFPRFGQLEVHQLSHSGIKPYRCLECGKCFTQKTRLKTHQSVHTGERPYSCKICGKMFSRQDNCIRHERFHSGLKPHTCFKCGKHFTALSNLKVHHQQVHT